jgi:hypothetical protein
MRVVRNSSAIVLLAMVAGLVGDASTIAADSTPEQVLKDRGLKRSGMLYVLEAESDFIPMVAKLQPDFRQLKATYDKLAAILINQAEYDALNDQWTLVNERWGNVSAEIDAHPPLSNNLLKQNWQNLLEAERLLRYQYNELRREVNLRYRRLVPDSEKERLRGAFLKQREEFLEKSAELRTQAGKIQDEYRALAQDEAVKKALDALKLSTKARLALGPSPEFKKASPWLTNAVKTTSPESLKPKGGRKVLKNTPKGKGATPGKPGAARSASKGGQATSAGSGEAKGRPD